MLSLKDLEAVSGCKVTRPPEQADSRKEERPSASGFWTSFAAAAARATKTKSGDAQAAQDLSVPTELWAHAIEFTPLDDAVRAKAISNALCRSARAALTKGRWAPVAKLVRAWAERDLATSATCLSVFDEDEPLPLYVTDELKTLFCAAWVAEPRLIAEMIGNRSDRPRNDIMTNFGLLLRAAEPELNDDALGRVFACMEHVDALWHLHGIRYSAAALIVQWQPSFYAIRNESPFLESYGWLSRLFRAGDRCGDGARVGNIIAGLLRYLVGWERRMRSRRRPPLEHRRHAGRTRVSAPPWWPRGRVLSNKDQTINSTTSFPNYMSRALLGSLK